MKKQRRRLREIGIAPGIFPPGKWNSITDVAGVLVGHVTLIQGEEIRTGVTAILPHAGNIHADKVPAGVVVGNGFGKLIGSTQIEESGEIETPIILTNTLAAPRAAEALIDWTLAQAGNEGVRSVNPVVGETNDSRLNNIRNMAITKEHVRMAIQVAASGPVTEGAVGAGTGTVCLGWKGGIGTSSRLVSNGSGTYTLGVLVQTNFGGMLQINGIAITKPTADEPARQIPDKEPEDGSIMMIVATDAPLSDRNLKRLSRRALAGLALTGASMSDGSGDYVIAFSAAAAVLRPRERRGQGWAYLELANSQVSPLFQAAIEASSEAIFNSLCMAETMTGYGGHTVPGLPLELIRKAKP
jgi:D-aminopeptidase